MSDERELATKYRKSAKAMREAARLDNGGKTAEALNKIANEYEQMAQALEGIDLTNRQGPATQRATHESSQ